MKVHARAKDPTRETSTSPIVYPIEYMLMTGEKRSDSIALSIGNYSNEAQMIYLLKQALVAQLRIIYAPETFTGSDIVMF